MKPEVWIGAPAPGGLALPDARPTASHLYGPRGVWIDGDHMVVADTGNHRVLVWFGVPAGDFAAADVVLGQPDLVSEGPASGGPARGLNLPTGVLISEGRLVVADAWHHRVLVWNTVPERHHAPPDVVLGQPGPECVDRNAGGPCRATTFYWPFGLAMVAGRFYVADTGNRRVLAWDGIPEPGEEPALVLGQPDPAANEENRGEIGPASFRWAHDVAGDDQHLYVADAGNHRVLCWGGEVAADRGADGVLGQRDFLTAREWPYGLQGPSALRFPYGIDSDSGRLAVADTANNRVLIWEAPPSGVYTPADHVLGQPDFDANGENRWDAVDRDTFCWPYGLCLWRDRLAVADSGNNRVMIWRLGS